MKTHQFQNIFYKMEQMMQSHRSTPKDGWIIGENGQIYGAARPQDIERYIFFMI